MPPKKKQKLLASNSKGTTMVPEKVSDVSPARLQLVEWVGQVYGGRHGHTDTKKFPLNNGGTFTDVVNRAWSNMNDFLSDSMDFVKRVGVLDAAATEDDFMHRFLCMKDCGFRFMAPGFSRVPACGTGHKP